MAKKKIKYAPPPKKKELQLSLKLRSVSLAHVIFLEPSNFWEPALEVEAKIDFAMLQGDFLTSLLLAFCWQKANKTVV